MRKIVFILCSLLRCTYSASTYDQRQTGDLNVQVDLKDLQIIALMKGNKEEYVDYDYAYDYSEMTIKPQNGTTAKPFNVTSPATEPYKNNTTIASHTVEQTILIAKDNNSLVTWYPAVNDSTTLPTTTKGTKDSEAASSAVTADITSATAAAESNCKKGFVLNHKGDCEIKLQSPGNAFDVPTSKANQTKSHSGTSPVKETVTVLQDDPLDHRGRLQLPHIKIELMPGCQNFDC